MLDRKMTNKVNPCGGLWHYNEIKHINVLELKTIFHGINIY